MSCLGVAGVQRSWLVCYIQYSWFFFKLNSTCQSYIRYYTSEFNSVPFYMVASPSRPLHVPKVPSGSASLHLGLGGGFPSPDL